MAKTVDKMAPYFSHLLSSWPKVATTRPDLTAQEVQTMVWQEWASRGANGKVGKGKRMKKIKDTNAPKCPPTLTYSEVLAKAGKKWKSLDEETRAPFVAEAKKKSEEYHQEKTKYKGL